MREQATETQEVREAKERFKVSLARLGRDTEKARAGEVEDVSDIAPHLLNRRR